LTILPRADSYMFHHPNVRWAQAQAEAIGIPIVMRKTSASKEEELRELREAIASLNVDGVVSGAVASEYQREKIDIICEEIGIASFAPLWKKNQESLLREIVVAGFEVVITRVAAEGFDETWLGRRIDEKCVGDLLKLNKRFGVSLCGEGGEFETFVLRAPFFKREIEIEKSRKVWKGAGGELVIESARVKHL
ncbi:MAG: diphthine--ammonia ligase, partial [Candidatus Micrarchaeota archaeon]